MITDRRKILTVGMLLILAAGSLCADWRTDVAAFFSGDQDFAGAAAYIEQAYRRLDEEYAPTLCALLAYSYSRLNRIPEEQAWIKMFFERYQGMGTAFGFLDPKTQMYVSTYLGGWYQEYPLILDVFLVEQKRAAQTFSPPAQIVLGIEITNTAFYRMMREERIIAGSSLHRGFNIVRVDADRLFSQPGVHVYTLELKKEDLELRREVRLDVDVTSPQFRTSPEAQAKKIEYTLSLFVGEEMISSLKKIERLETPLKLGFSNNALKGGKFDPLHRADPQGHPDPLSNSVSIPAVVAGIATLIKELFGKKDEGAQEPQIAKSKTQEFRYFRRLYGLDQETTARITLESRSLDIMADR
jgi:hypothetical protein